MVLLSSLWHETDIKPRPIVEHAVRLKSSLSRGQAHVFLGQAEEPGTYKHQTETKHLTEQKQKN
jgi:hypothetical protein